MFHARQESPRSVLLSEGLARRLWPAGDDPIDRQVWLSNGQPRTVIGVVGDVRHLGVARDAYPTMYFPNTWILWPTMSLVVRTSGDPAALAGSLRATAATLSPTRPLFDIQTMTSVIAANTAEPRLQAAAMAAFAGVSLLLAAIGVAGVVAYVVARRTPEFAVRLAIGATPRSVVGQALRSGLALCAGGVAIGVAAAVAMSAVFEGMLLGVRGEVGGAAVLTGVALSAVGLVASWLPARRAARISPALVLRGE
jgi:hypothetical protein